MPARPDRHREGDRRRRIGRVDDAVYRTAFEVSPLPICLFDLDGRYLRVNAAYCELVGARPDDILGRHVSAFNEPEENADSEENLRQLREGEVDRKQIRRRLRTTDGRTLHVTTSVTVLHHDGQPLGILSMVSDVTRHVEVEAELRLLALHDPLTGLANRQQLPSVLEALAGSGRPGALCFVDLDGFKAVNDTHGHQAADDLLASVGRRLREAVEPDDVALRVGGDEFVVVRPGVAHRSAAEHLGRQVIDAVGHGLAVGEQVVEVRASVGVAFDLRPDASLLARADAAMYEAKRAGGDQVVVAAPPSPAAG
ncbi:MAG: diguanylate cyclase domain-containing protein [Acidimicrobiia bacterium]